jgi:hypothetical protein
MRQGSRDLGQEEHRTFRRRRGVLPGNLPDLDDGFLHARYGWLRAPAEGVAAESRGERPLLLRKSRHGRIIARIREDSTQLTPRATRNKSSIGNVPVAWAHRLSHEPELSAVHPAPVEA